MNTEETFACELEKMGMDWASFGRLVKARFTPTSEVPSVPSSRHPTHAAKTVAKETPARSTDPSSSLGRVARSVTVDTESRKSLADLLRESRSKPPRSRPPSSSWNVQSAPATETAVHVGAGK